MLESFKGSYLKLIFIILLPFVFIACGGSSSSGGGGSSKFEVSVVDGYISKATVEDNASDEADENSNNLGHYTFSKTPTGELNASGGVFSESNITNRMVLKAPALSKVISPITTLLVDFPDLNSTLLQNALNVTEEQLVGNFLSADDLNIAKLAQIVYGMYVNDLLSEFKSSLNGSSPASLDDIFDIAEDIANSKGDAGLVAFLGAVESYSGSAEGLEDNIKEQKDALTSSNPFSLFVVDGYITRALVEDNTSNIAQENTTNLGEYIFSDTPFGVLSANGGVFIESNLSNLMSLKAPAQSAVISPITTLLVDFPDLNSTLQVALDVSETQLIGNFLENDDLNIAKLAQVIYIIYKTDIVDEANTSLTNSPPSNLDELIENIALVADGHITDNDIRANTLLFLDKVKTYDGNTDELEAFISPYKAAVQNEEPSLVNYWARAYGGSGDDRANSIIQTSDGGYAVAGYTTSFGVVNYDFWVLKLDSDGGITWQKTYGGSAFDAATSIVQTSDGGYVVAGHTNSFGSGDYDAWVLKLSSDGNITWQKAYGGSSDDGVYSIAQPQAIDDGYVVAGSTSSFGQGDSDAWVLKLDSNGNITWQKAYGGSSYDQANSIIQTSDGGYVVAGYTYSFRQGDANFWVLKLDTNGDIVWQRAYGGGGDDQANSIAQTSDGGYVVAGWTNSFSLGQGKDNFWVLKLDTNGDIVWQRAYGGGGDDQANSITQTSDGGYVVAGWTNSFSQGSSDFWLLKLGTNGDIVWQKTYGGSGSNEAYSITTTSDGGYVVAGYTSSFGQGDANFWVLKLDSDGDIVFRPTSGTILTNSTATPINSTGNTTNSTATETNSTAVVIDTTATEINTNADIYSQAP